MLLVNNLLRPLDRIIKLRVKASIFFASYQYVFLSLLYIFARWKTQEFKN